MHNCARRETEQVVMPDALPLGSEGTLGGTTEGYQRRTDIVPWSQHLHNIQHLGHNTYTALAIFNQYQSLYTLYTALLTSLAIQVQVILLIMKFSKARIHTNIAKHWDNKNLYYCARVSDICQHLK